MEQFSWRRAPQSSHILLISLTMTSCAGIRIQSDEIERGEVLSVSRLRNVVERSNVQEVRLADEPPVKIDFRFHRKPDGDIDSFFQTNSPYLVAGTVSERCGDVTTTYSRERHIRGQKGDASPAIIPGLILLGGAVALSTGVALLTTNSGKPASEQTSTGFPFLLALGGGGAVVGSAIPFFIGLGNTEPYDETLSKHGTENEDSVRCDTNFSLQPSEGGLDWTVAIGRKMQSGTSRDGTVPISRIISEWPADDLDGHFICESPRTTGVWDSGIARSQTFETDCIIHTHVNIGEITSMVRIPVIRHSTVYIVYGK